MEFTDKVMQKIMTEMVVRQKRKARWLVVLYTSAGIIGASSIILIMNYFEIIHFKSMWESTKEVTQMIIPYFQMADDILLVIATTLSSIFSNITIIITSLINIISKHSVAFIIICNIVILYILSYLLAPQKQP